MAAAHCISHTMNRDDWQKSPTGNLHSYLLLAAAQPARHFGPTLFVPLLCPSNEAVEGGDRGGGLYHSPNSISRSAGYSQIALKTTSKNFEVSREESALTLDRGRVSDFPVATACDLSVESVQLRNDDHSPPVLFPMPGILHFT